MRIPWTNALTLRPYGLCASSWLRALGGMVLAAAPIVAQSSTAALSGTAMDPSGAIVQNVAVTVMNAETNVAQSTITNESGLYAFPNLPPGRYRLTCKSPGFKETVTDNLVLHVQDTATVNVRMELGPATDSVTVTAATLLINTQDANVGAVVERQIVENMPLNGRSFQGLITLTPGVNTVGATSSNPGQFVANGQRSDTNYFTVDGVSANVAAPVLGSISVNGAGSTPATTANGGFNSMVSIDAMQEFRISTSSFAPEFGRTPGAQISLSSRSGTNSFHGDVFDYLRNTVLDANDWFLNAQGKPRGVVRQNDFGGVAGGPVRRNKLFFFASYEGSRVQAPSPAVKAVPTQAARTLASSLNDNGVTGYMAQFLSAYPLPDGNPATPCTSATTCVATYTATLPGTARVDAVSGRLDYSMNQRMSLFFRYSHAPSSTTSNTTVTATGLQSGNDVYTAGWTASFGPSLNNDLHFNFTHTTFVLEKNPPAFKGDLNSIFPAGYAQPPSSFPLTQMSIQLGSFIGGVDNFVLAPANADNGNNQVNLTDSVSYLKGSHALKFGGDFRQLNPSYDQSNFNWNNQFAGANNCPGGTPAYLCGMASLSNIQHNLPQHFQFREYSLFAQDTWKVTSRWMLTYGFRYEVNPAATSVNGHPGYSVSGNNFSLDNLSAMALNPFGAAIYATRWRNFAPRVGAAYELSRRPQWGRVLRAGYGIFYDTGSQAFAANSNPYSARANNLTLGPAIVLFPVSPANAQFVTPPAISLALPIAGQSDNLIDPGYKLPYTHQVNVSVEQQIRSQQSLTIGYVGAFGRHLLGVLVFPPSKGSPNVLGAAGVGDVLNFYGNYSRSDYHSLQVKFQRQFSHGLGGLASYTWSHSLDDQSTTASVNLAGVTSVAVPTAAALSLGLPSSLLRANSDFDTRHAINLSLVYDLPTPFSGNPLARGFLGHWSVDPIYHYQTALPIDVIVNSTANLAGATSLIQRPQLIPGVPVYASCGNCAGGEQLNTAPVSAATAAAAGCAPPTSINAKGAFCTPLPVGSQAVSGNFGRNVLRAFPLGEFDLSLHRDFPIRESIRVRFQADMFNVFNHPSFGPEGPNLSTATFGVANSMANSTLGAAASSGVGFSPLFNTGGPRNVQLAVKLFF